MLLKFSIVRGGKEENRHNSKNSFFKYNLDPNYSIVKKFKIRKLIINIKKSFSAIANF